MSQDSEGIKTEILLKVAVGAGEGNGYCTEGFWRGGFKEETQKRKKVFMYFKARKTVI